MSSGSETDRAMDYSPKAIRAARHKAGITQAQLASAIGKTTATVGAWESGKTAPPLTIRPLLDRVLFASQADHVVVELVARTTAASGVPLTVEDRVAIKRVAELLRAVAS